MTNLPWSGGTTPPLGSRGRLRRFVPARETIGSLKRSHRAQRTERSGPPCGFGEHAGRRTTIRDGAGRERRGAGATATAGRRRRGQPRRRATGATPSGESGRWYGGDGKGRTGKETTTPRRDDRDAHGRGPRTGRAGPAVAGRGRVREADDTDGIVRAGPVPRTTRRRTAALDGEPRPGDPPGGCPKVGGEIQRSARPRSTSPSGCQSSSWPRMPRAPRGVWRSSGRLPSSTIRTPARVQEVRRHRGPEAQAGRGCRGPLLRDPEVDPDKDDGAGWCKATTSGRGIRTSL